MAYKDIQKRRDYHKRWHEANKVKSNLKIAAWRADKKRRGLELLGGSCIICGYNKTHFSLDFHHKNPNEKEFNLSDLRSASWEKYEKELRKCIILCRNCHGEVHAG